MQATGVQKTYTSEFQYSCTSYFAKNLIGAVRNQTAAELCPTPQSFMDGSAVVAYNSTSFYDDLLWSSAWLWHLTGMSSCHLAAVWLLLSCCLATTQLLFSCFYQQSHDMVGQEQSALTGWPFSSRCTKLCVAFDSRPRVASCMCHSVHVQLICKYTCWHAHNCVRHLIVHLVQISGYFRACYTFSEGFSEQAANADHTAECRVSLTFCSSLRSFTLGAQAMRRTTGMLPLFTRTTWTRRKTWTLS